MQYNLLLKNGTVVDGTGAAAKRADVRIGNGIITEVGADLETRPRERVVDATDCYVTPGFIETHNHFDGPMWWMPNLDPMPGYGVTTSVNGNCGFSAAPVSDDPESRLEMLRIFSFFEDIPIQPFLKQLPWDWRKWSEYRQSMEANLKFSVNMAAYVGHIAIRLAVMGLEAWDRTATDAEIRQMAAFLDDALRAGALGLSTNLLDYDGKGRPVPSLVADDAEFEALLDVVARHEGATFQVIIDNFVRLTGVASMERMERFCGPRNIRMLWVGVPTYEFQIPVRAPIVALHERFKADGREFYTGFSHVPASNAISFMSSLVFAQSNEFVWHEIVTAPTEDEKLALLADPEWRARASASWAAHGERSRFSNPAGFELSESESGFGPVGLTLADFGAQRGLGPSDALAEWLLDNGVRSTVTMETKPKNRALTLDLWKDPYAVGSLSDAGAHGQMLCGIGDHINFLTDYVRDSGDLTIEQGINNLTAKQANFFNLHDRGVIAVGKRADIAVFDLNAVERRPTERVFDVPDGEGGRTWRYTREAAPMLLTLVNGVPTFEKGRFTGLFPGQVLSPAPVDLALAAE